MSRTPVEGFYSSCFLRFPRFHIEWTAWNGVNSHNLMNSIQNYVFLKICSLSLYIVLIVLTGQTGTKWGIRDQCLTQWVPSQGPLCVPALFPRQCGHKNTTSSHTRLYIYANPDNASTKNCATHNSFQGCFLGNRLPRLSSFEIHATDESLWKPQLHLLLPRSMTWWQYKMSRTWSNTQTGHLQPLQGVVVVEAVDLPDMQVVLQALPGIQCLAFS